jgi:diamine N-acetyltransferase
VTRENVRAICELQVAENQRRLVAPAAYTVAEGHYEPGAMLRAIYEGERPVGVLLVEMETGTPYLVR